MIWLPVVRGIIRRRLLVNFRVAADAMKRRLPARFRPKLHAGFAVAGVCLIRLEKIRPRLLPGFVGVASENGAHRVAVTWEEDGEVREGVYISRRDTSSLVNHYAGGRLFPGEHHHAAFAVEDDGERIDLRMRAKDDGVSVDLRARRADRLPATSIFASLEEASAFFATGSVGYSVTSDAHRLDGIRLVTKGWEIGALDVEHVESSFFADEGLFPKGSVSFDCALVMRDIAHEWESQPDLAI